MNRLTKITKRDIIKNGFNGHKIIYYGNLTELNFLKRLYNLEIMESKDYRFSNALEDYIQHRINKYDWEENWIFGDERFNLYQETAADKHLLDFICEMFNPFVRNEQDDWVEIKDKINDLLNIDGYELYVMSTISEREIYGWRMIESISLQSTQGSVAQENVELKLIGEGSYAQVFKFEDKNYNKSFALKRARGNLDDKELERFKREFDVLSILNSPYIVEVYKFFDEKNQFTMEYLDLTLKDYIDKNNAKLSFIDRKKIVHQFLQGINYLHSKKYLHRDISPKNILIKLYDNEIIKVKFLILD